MDTMALSSTKTLVGSGPARIRVKDRKDPSTASLKEFVYHPEVRQVSLIVGITDQRLRMLDPQNP